MNIVRTGETYYLIPRTLGPPAICYKQPKVTILRIYDPYVIVQLENGAEHEIHRDNLARSRPRPPRSRAAPERRPLNLPDGMKEVPLW